MEIDERPPGGEAPGARGGSPGGEGPLKQGAGARILQLAKDDPRAALSSLRKTIKPYDVDGRLKALVVGRQDAVCALVEIARTPDHFEEAAGLLLRLAATESGSAPNSAANMFARLFANVPSSMAPTKASANKRATLLGELLDSDDRQVRQTALSACNMALKTFHFERVDCESGRSIMYEHTIVGKEFSGHKRALAMLVERLGRMDPGERQGAVEIVLERAVELSQHRETSCEAADAVRTLYKKSLADRQRLIQAAEMSAGAHAGRMGGTALAAWKSLAAEMAAGA